jgi:hypothetical protein
LRRSKIIVSLPPKPDCKPTFTLEPEDQRRKTKHSPSLLDRHTSDTEVLIQEKIIAYLQLHNSQGMLQGISQMELGLPYLLDQRMFVHHMERAKEQLLTLGLIRYQYPDSSPIFLN